MLLSTLPNREVLSATPFVADILDPELQALLSQPIEQPISTDDIAWDYGQDINQASLPDNIRHLLPVVHTLIRVGELAPRSESEFLMLKVKQQAADTMNGKNFGWHADEFHKGFRRVLVSDRFGTRYKTSDGKKLITPDYGILVLDEESQHAPHETPDSSIRTLMLISRFA